MLERIRKIKHLEEFFGIIGFFYFILLAIIIFFLVRFLSTLTSLSVRVSQTSNASLAVFMIDRAKLIVSPSFSPASLMTAPLASSTTIVPGSIISTSSLISESVSGTVLIVNTPTGYLNVRSGPSSVGVFITRILPGEIYPYSKKENGWYFISISSSTEGWILGEYAKEQ